MPGKWKRPASVPYPSIWARFEGKREINGKMPTFWVQDIPEDMIETAVEKMCSNYIYDEPLCKYGKLYAEPESVEGLKNSWRHVLQDKCGLVCFMENPIPNGAPIIAGLNMNYVCEKDAPTIEPKGKIWINYAKAMDYITNLKDPFEYLNINKFLSALGLSVLPDFRGQGVGEQLLKARIPLGKAIGVRVTLTIFSSAAAQRAAEKVGFIDIINSTFEELQQSFPDFQYPGIQQVSERYRYMYLLF